MISIFLKIISSIILAICLSKQSFASDYRLNFSESGSKSIQNDEVLCFSYITVRIDSNNSIFNEWDRYRCLSYKDNTIEWKAQGLIFPKKDYLFIEKKEAAQKRIEIERNIITVTFSIFLTLFILGFVLFISSYEIKYFYFSIMLLLNGSGNLLLLLPYTFLNINYLNDTNLNILQSSLSFIVPALNIIISLELLKNLLIVEKNSKLYKIMNITRNISFILIFLTSIKILIMMLDPLKLSESLFNISVFIEQNSIIAFLVTTVSIVIYKSRKDKKYTNLVFAYVFLSIGSILFIITIEIRPQPLTGTIGYIAGSLLQALYFFLEIGVSIKNESQKQKNALKNLAENLDAEVKEKTAEIKSVLDSSNAVIMFFNENGDLLLQNKKSEESFDSIKNIKDFVEVCNMSSIEKSVLLSVLNEDIISWSLNEGNLPTKIIFKNNTFLTRFGYIELDGFIKGLTITLNDITEEINRDKKLEQASDEANLIVKLFDISFLSRSRLTQDIDNLKNAFSENKKLIKSYAHTLKGNVFSLGLNSFGEKIHLWELCKISDDEFYSECLKFEGLIHKVFSDKNKMLIDKKEAKKAFETKNSDLYLYSLLNPTIETIIKDNPAYLAANDLAKRLEKSEPKFIIINENINIKSEYVNAISTFLTHAIRNSLDHGFEKKEKATDNIITIESFVKDNQLTVKLYDNGNGLNIKHLHKKFPQKEIKNEENLYQLANSILEEGVSTKETVTEISGMGVGLAAVKNALESFGALIKINLKDTQNLNKDFYPMELCIVIDNYTV